MPHREYIGSDLITLIEVIRKMQLETGSIYLRFTDLLRYTGWHQQKLTRVLRRGIRLGLVTRHSDGYDLNIPTNMFIYESMGIALTIAGYTDGSLIMEHRVYAKLRNVDLLDVRSLFIRVYGDIFWDKPLKVRYQGVEVVKKLSDETCQNKICNFFIKLNEPIKPMGLIEYEYEFYLYYYPPRDYFSIDLVNSIKRLMVKVPRSYNDGKVMLDLIKVEAPGGLVKVYSDKDYYMVYGIGLLSPGMVTIPLLFKSRNA